jgi:hypothetical protein
MLFFFKEKKESNFFPNLNFCKKEIINIPSTTSKPDASSASDDLPARGYVETLKECPSPPVCIGTPTNLEKKMQII